MRHMIPRRPASAGILALCVLGLAVALSPAQAQNPLTLDRVKANGQMAVGYRESSVPFSYLDGSGQPARASSAASPATSGPVPPPQRTETGKPLSLEAYRK